MFLAATLAASLAAVLPSAPAHADADIASQSGRRAKPAAPVTEREYATGPAIPKLRYQQMLPSLKLVRPVQVFQRPGDAANIYIIEQPGRILVADP